MKSTIFLHRACNFCSGGAGCDTSHLFLLPECSTINPEPGEVVKKLFRIVIFEIWWGEICLMNMEVGVL